MKIATIFLFVVTILSLVPNKQVQIEPLLEQEVSVFVTGEGAKSTELYLHKEAKVKDVINLIDLQDDADIDSLNLNETIYQDMVININLKSSQACVSINSADLETLMTLKGIGERTALNIIEYRKTTPFYVLEDLMNVPLIGPKKFEAILNQICL